MALSRTERAILDLERVWWTLGIPKREAIRERLSLSPSRYYKILGELLDDAEAMQYDPLVVRRLLRSRDQRRRARYEGTSAEGPPLR